MTKAYSKKICHLETTRSKFLTGYNFSILLYKLYEHHRQSSFVNHYEHFQFSKVSGDITTLRDTCYIMNVRMYIIKILINRMVLNLKSIIKYLIKHINIYLFIHNNLKFGLSDLIR